MTDPWSYAPGTAALGDWERDNSLFPAEDKWAAARAYDRAMAKAIAEMPVTSPDWMNAPVEEWK